MDEPRKFILNCRVCIVDDKHCPSVLLSSPGFLLCDQKEDLFKEGDNSSNTGGRLVQLPHPSSGAPSLHFVDEDNNGDLRLFEFKAFNRAQGECSMFIGDFVKSRKTDLVLLVETDPLLFLLPYLDRARRQCSSDSGCYTQVDELLNDTNFEKEKETDAVEKNDFDYTLAKTDRCRRLINRLARQTSVISRLEDVADFYYEGLYIAFAASSIILLNFCW
eukprot:TRINITY_DN21632_c0_g1_i5.p1 TRINITY_DN21632_c0_g1~~TRINITY_DN21632_c0_g1_i5.p1  ORF type:complete len:219 (-),score=24.21 TRINITY_DN21632_c0_g1_i5:254-910(-)